VWLKAPVVIIGLGELGQVLATGFLKMGHPVFPLNRGASVTELSTLAVEPFLIVVAVGEKDLDGILMTLPDAFKNRVLLLQNNLLRPDWQKHQILSPTILVAWLDKKPGRPSVSVLPNKVFGPYCDEVAQALNALHIETYSCPIEDMDRAMVAKNLYIHTINIAGLRVAGTVGELWKHHRALAEGIMKEILQIQCCRLGSPLDEALIIQDTLRGFAGDWNHICMGRSAPQRLANALKFADGFHLDTPILREIALEIGLSGQGSDASE
jgi:ketopantoate reductase